MVTEKPNRVTENGIQRFSEAVEAFFLQLASVPDEQCIGLKREQERRYLLSHEESARQNIRMIQNGLLASSGEQQPVLLDIGTSPLTFLYGYIFPSVRISTVDLTSLLASRCINKGIEHHVCDLKKDPLPFEDEQMDVVVFTEVLEHLNCGPKRIFSEIFRVLRPGGSLVFSVPNTVRLLNRIRFLFGRPVLEPVYKVFKEDQAELSKGNGNWVHGLGHLREYTMAESHALLRHYGFRVVSSRSIDANVKPGKEIALTRRLLMPIYRIASSLVPNSKMINLVLAEKL